MRVRCTGNTAGFLGPARVGLWYHPEYEWATLEVGQEYEVYGLRLVNDGLSLMVADRGDNPEWFPVGLFEVTDPSIPPSWEIAFFPSIYFQRPPMAPPVEPQTQTGSPEWQEEKRRLGLPDGPRPGVQFVMGYRPLTQPEHLLALQDRDEHALAFFDDRVRPRPNRPK